jgi:molybdate transport system permease protein
MRNTALTRQMQSKSEQSVVTNDERQSPPKQNAYLQRSDVLFYVVVGLVSSCYVLLIASLLIADVAFTTWDTFVTAFTKPEIQSSLRLTLLTCTVSALMALGVAVPMGYSLARFSFRGRWLVDTVVDVPLMLPPLVLGLSLLILFHLPINGWELESWLRDDIGFGVTYRWPAVILAQFTVAAAFAIRTMRITFEQINPRAEDVARTLGCTRAQAFARIAVPQASRGMIAAGTVAWARSLGEFGPILVFAGATRMKTEVLSTSVFLELNVGQLQSAVAVSLAMVLIAVSVVIALRLLGARVAG